MTDNRMFLAGLAAGAVGGLYVGRRLAVGPSGMPHLEINRRALAKTRGPIQATLLAAQVQARYDELYAGRPRFNLPALRQHLETNILPGLALYQTLREENDDQEAVMAELDQILAAWVEDSEQSKLIRIMNHLPDPFGILRISNRVVLKMSYPPEGWTVEWVEDSDRCIAYDIRDCFYLNMLTAYGAPELTAHFCRGDDLVFGSIPGIAWERTETLGRGDDRCNFRFCNQARPELGGAAQ
jgi:L-2-amino-thiazoline-4-carboxylic acid hydrolase